MKNKIKSEDAPNAKVWTGKYLFTAYLTVLYALNLHDILEKWEILAAYSIQSKGEKMIGDYLPQIKEYYESLKNELELKGQPWHYVPTSMRNILLFEFTNEINERLKLPEDAEDFSVILNWLEKSPKSVEISLLQEWSLDDLDDFNGEANRTVLVRLTDKKKTKVAERRVVLWMKNIKRAIEFIAWDSQRKVLQGKIIGLSKPNANNIPQSVITDIDNGNNHTEMKGLPLADFTELSTINLGVSKWNAPPDLLVKIFMTIAKKTIAGKPAIEITKQNLETLINQNFVNKEGNPLLGIKNNGVFEKIKVNCNAKALTELFLYLTHEKIDKAEEQPLTYLEGYRETVKRILSNCFVLKVDADSVRKYIQEFDDSVELNGLDNTVSVLRKQPRKLNFIRLIEQVLLSK